MKELLTNVNNVISSKNEVPLNFKVSFTLGSLSNNGNMVLKFKILHGLTLMV